jgi:hypothetical protein
MREEFEIALQRPRDINDPALAVIAQRITLTLKDHLLREAA